MQPGGNVAANNKSGINRCYPLSYRSERPGRCVPGGQCPDPAGRPCPPLGPAAGSRRPWPRRVTQPGRPDSSAATWAAAEAPTSGCPSHLPGPHPRASAAGRGAGFPLSTPRLRCPRPPAAAPNGRKRLRSNRFQLLQTKPPGHPAGRGRSDGGAGPDVTPGALPANRRPRAAGRPLRSWKGSLAEDERGRVPRSPKPL